MLRAAPSSCRRGLLAALRGAATASAAPRVAPRAAPRAAEAQATAALAAAAGAAALASWAASPREERPGVSVDAPQRRFGCLWGVGGSGRALRCEGAAKPILVVGSLNADIILEIGRFPRKGETLGTRKPDTGYMVPGGKGANQAVAASRLSKEGGPRSQFVCQLGNDSHAKALETVLLENRLDISACGRTNWPSGQAFIFLEEDGSNSILIVGGANIAWPEIAEEHPGLRLAGRAGALLLQKEIPEHVNEEAAAQAAKAGVPVILDVGGEDRPNSDELLRRLTFICPNETELERLSGMSTSTEQQVVAAARHLQKKGVKNVLVTLGSDGALLLTETGQVLKQGTFQVPGGKIVDTTGAGDAFRAAFSVAFVEGRPLQECLKFAAAAGAITVSRMGAIPSLPFRDEVERIMRGEEIS